MFTVHKNGILTLIRNLVKLGKATNPKKIHLIEILGRKIWTMFIDWNKSDRKKWKQFIAIAYFRHHQFNETMRLKCEWAVHCEYYSRHTDYHWWKYNHIIIIVLYFLSFNFFVIVMKWFGIIGIRLVTGIPTHKQWTYIYIPNSKMEKRCMPRTSIWTWME